MAIMPCGKDICGGGDGANGHATEVLVATAALSTTTARLDATAASCVAAAAAAMRQGDAKAEVQMAVEASAAGV